MPNTLIISHPKLLTEIEWNSISGSDLHATMVKNRSIVDIAPGYIDSKVKQDMRDKITSWLSENCNSTYYVTANKNNNSIFPMRVYIEGDPDSVLFKITFVDMELAEPPPPAPQKASPIPMSPSQSILDQIKKKKKATDDRLKEDAWRLFTDEVSKSKTQNSMSPSQREYRRIVKEAMGDIWNIPDGDE